VLVVAENAKFGWYDNLIAHKVKNFCTKLQINTDLMVVEEPTGEILNVTNIGQTTYLDVKIPKKLETTVYREYGNLLAYFLIVLFFIIGYAIRIKQNS